MKIGGRKEIDLEMSRMDATKDPPTALVAVSHVALTTAHLQAKSIETVEKTPNPPLRSPSSPISRRVVLWQLQREQTSLAWS